MILNFCIIYGWEKKYRSLKFKNREIIFVGIGWDFFVCMFCILSKLAYFLHKFEIIIGIFMIPNWVEIYCVNFVGNILKILLVLLKFLLKFPLNWCTSSYQKFSTKLYFNLWLILTNFIIKPSKTKSQNFMSFESFLLIWSQIHTP